ncbi:MAG: MBL fold metallo-hydrolase [Chloroflexi bacterium]|nr:MBL fold metallo-hydrolase [Chloroflexota bacterium]
MLLIAESVYAVPGMSVGRIYVIAGRDGLALVDTSLSPQTPERLEPQLHRHGYTLDDIRHILITHAHPDHIGGLAAFQQRINARTAVHRRDAPIVRGEQPQPRPRPEDVRDLSRLMLYGPTMPPPIPARVDRELTGGDTLDEILPGLEVVETFGHSPGHVAFWWPDKRLLFAGDVVMHLPWTLALPIAAFTQDMAEEKRSVLKIADLNPDILCPGHGRPITGGAGAALRRLAQRLKR